MSWVTGEQESTNVLCVKPVSCQQEMPHASHGFVAAGAVGVIKMNLNESCKIYSRMKPGEDVSECPVNTIIICRNYINYDIKLH